MECSILPWTALERRVPLWRLLGGCCEGGGVLVSDEDGLVWFVG